VRALRDELEKGLEGVPQATVRQRLAQVSSLLEEVVKKNELSGPVYEDVIHLKSIYSRYQNYAHWLKQSARG